MARHVGIVEMSVMRPLSAVMIGLASSCPSARKGIDSRDAVICRLAPDIVTPEDVTLRDDARELKNRGLATLRAVRGEHEDFHSHRRRGFRRERAWHVPRQGWKRHLGAVRSDGAGDARGVRPRSLGSARVLQCASPQSDRGQSQRGPLRSCSNSRRRWPNGEAS